MVILKAKNHLLFRKGGSVSELNRREFIKSLAVGGAVLGLGGIMVHKPLEALASGKYDIGQCNIARACPGHAARSSTLKTSGSLLTSQYFI